MMYRFILLFLFVPAMAMAQPVREDSGVPKLVIRTSLFPLAQNLKQSANLAADIRINSRLSADLGLGWMLGSVVFARYHGESYQGPRIRVGFKYFLHGDERQAAHIGLEGLVQEVLHQKYRNVWRQGGQYAETILDRRYVRTTGLYLRTGMQFYLGRQRRWMVEPQLGVGMKFHKVWRDNPADVEIPPPLRGSIFSFEYRDGRCSTIAFPMALQVGYLLWR